MNVIDDAALQKALGAVGDGLAKDLVTQVLPVVGALVDSTVTKLCAELETVSGATLADLTAERTEMLSDLHGLVDRLNGVHVELTLTVPPRVRELNVA